VCAVSYLNTVPLVWGLLHGPQKDRFALDFRVPSGCADELESGEADIGIVPSFELTRLSLDVLPGVGIACHGAVRSILLISRCPAPAIRRLAADTSSRTSVQLARVVLAQRYGAFPEMVPHEPRLDAMLETADAALIIGDPALHLDPSVLPFHVYDLGAEWLAMTGHSMVFAVWAARPGIATPELAEAFRASYRFGQAHLEEIIAAESPARGFSPELVREYLTHTIRFELGEAEYAGMREYLRMATAVNTSPRP
jgi:chorismate dehydratase